MKSHKIRRNKKTILAMAILTLLNAQHCGAAEEMKAEPAAFTLDGITVEASRPDWESKLSPGSVTVIRPDDYKGEQKTLPDLLKTVPGIHVREVNGKGQYTTVSVRGSTASQVGIFVDGVLTNLGGDSAVDISTLPIKNVERIEVYRGYIPSRFGGTYMGGVINIVTKRPTKANVSAEIGQASYGGANYSLQIDTPVGKGSLLFGLNREQSDGDFKYKNYASEKQYAMTANEYQKENTYIVDFDKNNIQNNMYINLSADEKTYYLNNIDAWTNFISDTSSGTDNFYNRSYALQYSNAAAYGNNYDVSDLWAGIKIGSNYSNFNDFANAWDNFTQQEKEAVYNEYAEKVTLTNMDKVDPDKSTVIQTKKELMKKYAEQMKCLDDETRWRKYNDFKNTDAIIKWQDDNWSVKGTWKSIDRHLPDTVWGNSIVEAPTFGALTDAMDIYESESRHQKIDTKELQVERRDHTGKLEWGWMLNYMDQDKDYRTEKPKDPEKSKWNTPMRLWSKYMSDRYTGKIDGTYNLGDQHLLEFLINYSKEKMKIRGNNLDTIPDGSEFYQNYLKRYRNYYEQDLFNVQLQDTITLDKGNTFWLTPSLKYNRSEVIGRSNRLSETDLHQWFNREDNQTDDKVTWQVALKKEVNKNLTLRTTAGTYFRLLNLYEIAGDGAGILPAPGDANGLESMFPRPEDGKQVDVSAIMNGKIFGADNKTTLTAFWRKADNMLVLSRAGLDYWSYFNDSRGKIRGIELESNFNWNKFDLNLSAAYMHYNLERRDTAAQYENWQSVWPTYSPEWEGSLRLNYNPTSKLSIFSELKYVDEMFTSRNKDITNGGYDSYLKGMPQSSLTTVGAGFKYKPKEDMQLTFGCNDIFNEGPKCKIYYDGGYVNNDFPIQGRTYYVTVKYNF